MGLGRVEIEMLIHEHSYKPIEGEILAIGRQNISLTPEQILPLLKQHGVDIRSEQFDPDVLNTHHGVRPSNVSDVSFFRSFSDAKYLTADISAYEGADFIFDICGEVPKELVGRFDFILDGGSLDNVFDPFKMLANMTAMLKPGGRMFINAWSNSFPTAYMKITPDWLMDYLAVNEFADAKLYVSHHEAANAGTGGLATFVELFHYDPLVETDQGPAYGIAAISLPGLSSIYCVAEKGETTTNGRTAVQTHYRGDNIQPYLNSALRFRASPRPVFSQPGTPLPGDIAPITNQVTVKPVARFGRKIDHTLEQLATSRLDRLAVGLNGTNRDVQTLALAVRDLSALVDNRTRELAASRPLMWSVRRAVRGAAKKVARRLGIRRP